ncbi:serine protease [Pilimelia terevasa]|uniref:Serine protease n=1 Tax=Pilimelia terevasa TaxID=53372 RepID=A0A8J3BMY7_9ACTN|nr:serine protease [Pilimelia terevasa]GGK34039.1 serine protease [Pilimelia terevasa]
MRLTSAAAAALAAAVLCGAWGAPAAAGPDDPAVRIVGGKVSSEKYPYTGQLGGCGASLIAPTWLVTAQHCVSIARQVRLDSNSANSGGEVIRVKRAVNGPGGKDIALLELAQPARTTPIRIAPSHPGVGTRTRIMGWGSTTPDGSSQSNVLKELDTSVLEARQCANLPGGVPPADGARELCTQSPNNQGACHGDSGGPQITQIDGTWYLVGATSRGAPRACARNSSPSIYMSVPAFIDWIRTTTGISSLGR